MVAAVNRLMPIPHHLSMIAKVILALLLISSSIRRCDATIPHAWESDLSQGSWWCSTAEANNFYPIQERHLDINNVVHLSAHGLTALHLCNLYFAAAEPIYIDWLERWSADDPLASISMYTRFYSWDAWRLVWTVSMKTYRTPPPAHLFPTLLPSQLVRLEFRNPSRSRIDFSIVVRPASYVGPLNDDQTASEDGDDSGTYGSDDPNYFGYYPPEEWEVGLIVVCSCFAFCLLGIAIYFLITHLCKRNSHLQ